MESPKSGDKHEPSKHEEEEDLGEPERKKQKQDPEQDNEESESPKERTCDGPCIGIRNFVRPFKPDSVKQYLEETAEGKIEKFWVSQLKSHCYVQFDTKDAAERALNKLSGIVYQPEGGKKLDTETLTESDLEKIIEGNSDSFLNQKDQSSKPRSETHNGTEEGEEVDEDDEEEKVPETMNAEKLDSLFKKTKAKPHLYYLPLTEDQVEDKKKKETEDKERDNERDRDRGHRDRDHDRGDRDRDHGRDRDRDHGHNRDRDRR